MSCRKELGQSSSGSKKKQKMKDATVFELDLGNLRGGYEVLLSEILETIKSEVDQMCARQPAFQRLPKRIFHKLYTPPEGVFLVRLVLNDEVITLLFRWSNLYFLGFHSKNIWYLLKDCESWEVPPRSQLFYDDIKSLGKSGNYHDIGGFNIMIGEGQFIHCFRPFAGVAEALRTGGGLKALISAPLSFPALVISEPLRFLPYREWIKT
ncbi:uncharacterized protein LOC112269781 [Brachypodium distachyon]|uniref:rRNA N-glycosylase n=1 Tax=Brachypodium distachyon TaxID=15368 RepID=A0A2K2DK01_BRADI|nr:uncharacterized protein LOC112269781 [Brachypodium distachyon]PNT74604.1 hypothetical protein BRADI_1g18695v3 [Brachypodium distachyon]|eukprot:XP_024312683.1 uncharacterized protein LOC112269781 [Brachypodium distachyon]